MLRFAGGCTNYSSHDPERDLAVQPSPNNRQPRRCLLQLTPRWFKLRIASPLLLLRLLPLPLPLLSLLEYRSIHPSDEFRSALAAAAAPIVYPLTPLDISNMSDCH